MRNAMLLSLAIFLVGWWALTRLRNHGLWASFYVHYAARTGTLLLYFPALVRSVAASDPALTRRRPPATR